MSKLSKVALITGITGQDGSYLAEFLLAKNYEVHGIIRRSSVFNTERLEPIYQDPHAQKRRLFLHYGDLSDASNLNQIIKTVKPDEIYNLGAQSHVKVSFEIPEYTANADGLGTLRLLDAVRESGVKTKIYQAGSSEMFGQALETPQKETTPFNPASPYAASKVFAHQLCKIYREGYKMFISNGILFNHECLTAQTPVIIKKDNLIDIVAIEEIVPHRENPKHGIKYITVSNGEIQVWDGSEWTKIKTLTATWNKAGSRSDKQIKKVICRGGYYEATKDHVSFLNGRKEVKTADLKPGDNLELKALPNLSEKTVLTLEEAEFLGMMVADGYISQDGKGRFINNDERLRKKISRLWQAIAGGCSREGQHPSGFVKGQTVKSVEFAGNPHYFRYMWQEVYNQKFFKKVPKKILNAGQAEIKAFLRGYNLCDGLKAGRQKTEFKSFTTNSAVLALGLWYLVENGLHLRITMHPEFRNEKVYFHLNINAPNTSLKGKHLQKNISEVKAVKDHAYTGWLFDLETENGTFSAGVGLTWVHNSPRRGKTFVTRKITAGIADILAGKAKKIYLGNLNAKRDWGYAPEYIKAMWLMLQQNQPDDFVIATGETHSIREFLDEAFGLVGIKNWKKYIGIDPKYYRPVEVNLLKGDAGKAKRILGWKPKVRFKELVRIMLVADLESAGINLKI
jgi:GDPmannose 4,6-dehydratase